MANGTRLRRNDEPLLAEESTPARVQGAWQSHAAGFPGRPRRPKPGARACHGRAASTGQTVPESGFVHACGKVRHLSGLTGLMRQRFSSVNQTHAPSGRLDRTRPRRSGARTVSSAMKAASDFPRNAAMRAISASETRTMPSGIRQHAPQQRHLKANPEGVPEDALSEASPFPGLSGCTMRVVREAGIRDGGSPLRTFSPRNRPAGARRPSRPPGW